MFAVAHAARSRTPLPQFMSSPIEAVHAWATAVEDHLNSGTRSRSRSPSSRREVENMIPSRTTSPELAVLYACAEREALYQLSHSVVEVSDGVYRKPRISSNASDGSILTAAQHRSGAVRRPIIPLSATTAACRRGGNFVSIKERGRFAHRRSRLPKHCSHITHRASDDMGQALRYLRFELRRCR